MGIRFYCPNGHKLNVKEFQAGLKGICPYCGTKIQIPTESTRSPSKKGDERAVEPDAAELPAEGQSLPAVVSDRADAGVPTVEPASSPPPAESAGRADPLAEAGDVVWYVRPPNGGQFGPAGADVMRTWISEGRVSPDCLVWREGWRDWQEASHVFPTSAAGEGDHPPAEAKIGGTSARMQGRRKSVSRQALVIILLVFAVIILSVVFVFELTNPPQREARVGGCVMPQYQSPRGRGG